MGFEEMLKAEASKPATNTADKPDAPALYEAKPPGKFDTRGILADLTAMEGQSNQLVNEAEALEVKTEADNSEAVAISGKLQKLSKAVEGKAKEFTEPYREVVSQVNGKKKTILDRIKRSKDILNQKIWQFKKRLELEKAKQQKKIEEATKKLQKDLDEDAKKSGVKAPKVAPIKAPEPAKNLRGKDGSTVYSRKDWVCDIVDSDKIPMFVNKHRLCLPSQKLLNQAVKMGERSIPGCNIYEKEVPITRSG